MTTTTRFQSSARPLTDAFGTRLDPRALVEGLDSAGLRDSRLVVTDDGFVLECDEPSLWRDETARALTWLRAKLSPLVPLRTRKPEGEGERFVDARTRPVEIVAFVEIGDPERELVAAIDELGRRLGIDVARGVVQVPAVNDPARAELAKRVASAAGERLGDASLALLVPGRTGFDVVSGASSTVDGPRLLAWFRPGGEVGPRPAAIVAASKSRQAMEWLARELSDARGAAPAGEILLDGLAWRASRRPTVAAREDAKGLRIVVDADRCTHCGTCAAMCPEEYLAKDGTPATDDVTACTRCYDCVDACPTDAIRPTYDADTATLASGLAHREGWLSRLAGLPGPSFPAPFPPSYLLPKKVAEKPRYVLGLAVMTMQEHAAALLKDGEIVGAVEHEKLVRVRHAGWHPDGRPGVTAAVDPTIALEEALCRRPIRALLEQAGITLDDVDVIAVNGLHGRYVERISFVDAQVELPVVKSGRVVYLPHHLCHAASALRASGVDDGWVFTVDGRGDRECAALWRGDAGKLRLVDTMLSLTDRSIGGVYEGITRLLGFGSHGQGSVMALAAFGSPTMDVSDFLGVDDHGDLHVHESGLEDRFGHLRRAPDEPLTQAHKDLAASLQAALESVALRFVRRSVGDGPVDALMLGGGVTLNCRMNERLRRELQPKVVFAQPGANDAGTALGAALEAWSRLGGARVKPMKHAYLGPSFDDARIERAIAKSGLAYRRSDDVARDVAAKLADGQVVCWFQGGLEFGPRALGHRSILADPRRGELHAKVNGIKERESWRPFGPSMLAGHEAEWIVGAFDARFMLFTQPVVEDKRALIPAVVHVDGTTRPQVVHAEESPRYHALISEFHRLTGVPMVLNTSFNRRGEPIVATPEDALESFQGLAKLGADLLVLGDFVVEPKRAVLTQRIDRELASLPGGRRLSLRLTTRCDLDCGHCTLRDQHGRDDRSHADALEALRRGREAGCDELVILRGEASLRPDLPVIVGAAKRLGYRFVQLQTNGAPLADPRTREALLAAGVDAFEVQLLAADEALHDELSGAPGAFRAVITGLAALAKSRRQVLVTIPVLQQNLRQLGALVQIVKRVGLARVQFNFPRPVELEDAVLTSSVPRLAIAARAVQRAAKAAHELGLTVTTEAIPFCHLPPELRGSPDATEEWRRHRVDDLHLTHDSLDEVRVTQRPLAAPCRTCRQRDACPKTWALYLELFGTDELVPFV